MIFGFISLRRFIHPVAALRLRRAVSFYNGPGTCGVLEGELVVSAKKEKMKSPGSKDRDDGAKPSRNVGEALRQAYDETVGEAVPDDLLDLLKKLD